MTNKTTVKTWRERLGFGLDFPLHAPTDVERAMESEIAELREAQHSAQAVPSDEMDRLRDDLQWHKDALAAVRGKLDSVWQGVRDAVEKYTGKPCEGEPFDRLDELLRAQQDAGAQLDKMWKARFMISKALHNVMVGNQSAWIEWKHGAGAEAAMQWIENGLIGPGLIPSGTEAQAWFDANQDDRYEVPPRPAAEFHPLAPAVSAAAGEGGQKRVYGPDNPPRLRKPGESVEEYRVAMGWSQPKPAAAHSNGLTFETWWTAKAIEYQGRPFVSRREAAQEAWNAARPLQSQQAEVEKEIAP